LYPKELENYHSSGSITDGRHRSRRPLATHLRECASSRNGCSAVSTLFHRMMTAGAETVHSWRRRSCHNPVVETGRRERPRSPPPSGGAGHKVGGIVGKDGTPLRANSTGGQRRAARPHTPVRWTMRAARCCFCDEITSGARSPKRTGRTGSTRCCAWSKQLAREGMTLMMVHARRKCVSARDVGTKDVSWPSYGRGIETAFRRGYRRATPPKRRACLMGQVA